MIIKQAIEVLKIEADGILSLIDKINGNFELMVDEICRCKGRVIIGGIGKSGIIGRKIVATLNSTGTNSFFLHPVEAMHGDLGMVSSNDIFLALSNSGETEELNILIPSIQKVGCTIIGFTGNCISTLAKQSDIVIDVGIKREAGSLGLAPTTSTTALLAMGDALAMVLMNKKKFNAADFKKTHPGGLLGQRLSYKVQEIMFFGKNIPIITMEKSVYKALQIIDKLQFGVVFVINEYNVLIGIITDGDIRHCLANNQLALESNLTTIMTKNPIVAKTDMLVYEALNIMEKHQITVLPVINACKEIVGILHLHDILGKGAFHFTGAREVAENKRNIN